MSEAEATAVIAAVAAIIVALIGFAGTIITVLATNSKTVNSLKTEIEVSRNVTQAEITALSSRVDKHNHFAERVQGYETFKEDVLDRLDRIEKMHMKTTEA